MEIFSLTLREYESIRTYQINLNGNFIEDLIALNIINFVDITRREKDEVHEM